MKYAPLQLVEQFHLLFLDQLGRKLDKRHFVLKGGCNLRFFLKSIRYSEDMDFDVHTIERNKLQERVNAILKGESLGDILKVRGIQIANISEAKQTDTTQRWKFHLKTSLSGVPLYTKIEFSRRGMQEDTLFEAIDPALIRTYKLQPIMATHYPPSIAYRQKVEALAGRPLTQARDVFDLHLLISSGAETILPSELKDISREAQERAMSVSFEEFKSQVVAYLPLDYQAQYDSETVWDEIVLTVVEKLKSEDV